MSGEERRRAARQAVDLPGELFLSEGRHVAVRILNLGPLGALVLVTDLETGIQEGERVVLGHPIVGEPDEGDPDVRSDRTVRTPGAVVRVDLEFSGRTGVSRNLAVYFDGGGRPDGCAA